MKKSEIYKGDQRPGDFSRGVTHFYGSSLVMTFEFSRISKTSLTSVEYLKRHFLNRHACFFRNRPLIHRWIFLSRCWDIYPAHCTGLELFLELPQNKICYILHPKYTSFSCFPIFARLQSESLYFNKIRVTYAIFDILKEADWMLFQASADKFCYVPTILLYILWKYKYWCIQKGLCDIM